MSEPRMKAPFREVGVRVRITEGLSKGCTGVTTGAYQKVELGHLVGVDIDSVRRRMVREDWLEPEECSHAG